MMVITTHPEKVKAEQVFKQVVHATCNVIFENSVYNVLLHSNNTQDLVNMSDTYFNNDYFNVQ